MPCLHTESPVRNPTDTETPPHPAPETTERSKKKKKEERQSGRELPSLWSLRTKTGQWGFRKGLEGAGENHTVESWSEDPTSNLRSCRENSRGVKMSGWVQMHPKLSMLLLGRRRDSHPPCGSSWRIATPAALEKLWLCLTLNNFENCRGDQVVRSLLFPETPDIQQYHQPPPRRSPCSAGPCGLGKCCDWMMGLLGGGFSHLKLRDICHKVLVHICDIVAAERCCLAVTTIDDTGGRVLGPFFQTTATTAPNHTQSDWDRCIMGHVASTGWPLNISDAHEDTRSHIGVDGPATSRPKSVLSVPIKSQQDEVIGIVMAVNKTGTVSFFSKQDEKVLTSHMTLLGVILENKQLMERSEQECHHNQVLLELVKLLTEHHQCLETVLSKLSGVILQASKAKLCKIFLSNESGRECFSYMVCAELDNYGGLTHHTEREFDVNDLSYMYAVRACNSMKTLNISNVTGGQSVTQSAAGVQSLICAPIKDPQRNLVLGVCELQKVRTDSDEGSGFSREDERLLQSFVKYCALALHTYSVQQAAEKNSIKLAIAEEVLSYHISGPVDEAEALEKCTVPSAHSLGLTDFSFTDADMSMAASTQAAVRMFLDLDLLQNFNMEYKTLCRWVLSVRRGYRSNIAYHNWSHALSTAHCMFAIISRTEQLQSHLSRLEILALMISALSHDLDHRGVNNSYIHRAQQPLSQLYTHSTLEHHHLNICLLILNNPDCRILCNLSAEDYKVCVEMIEKNILATDLTVHIRKRSEFFDMVANQTLQWEKEEHRDLLRSVLMTACDVCAITKPWKEQKRIARLVAEEFFTQGDREKREFNIQPIAVMDRQNSTRLADLQVQYIDSICCPLYTALSSLFDSCSPLLEGCMKNRQKWQMRVEKRHEKRSAVKE